MMTRYFSGLLTLAVIALSPLIVYPVISPMFKKLQQTVDECARTPVAQRKRCEPLPPIGVVIPGLL